MVYGIFPAKWRCGNIKLNIIKIIYRINAVIIDNIYLKGVKKLCTQEVIQHQRKCQVLQY